MISHYGGKNGGVSHRFNTYIATVSSSGRNVNNTPAQFTGDGVESEIEIPLTVAMQNQSGQENDIGGIVIRTDFSVDTEDKERQASASRNHGLVLEV